jgi:hypothetical protein
MGKVNKSLKAWVAFVKSVQKKYKLSYRDAIHKAKELKDKGADWMNKGLKSMKGGEDMEVDEETTDMEVVEPNENEMEVVETEGAEMDGGRRHRRRTRRRRVSRSRSRARGRSRALKRTMSRRKSASRKASRSMGLVMGVA